MMPAIDQCCLRAASKACQTRIEGTRLYKSDGTAAGTVPVSAPVGSGSSIIYADDLINHELDQPIVYEEPISRLHDSRQWFERHRDPLLVSDDVLTR